MIVIGVTAKQIIIVCIEYIWKNCCINDISGFNYYPKANAIKYRLSEQQSKWYMSLKLRELVVFMRDAAAPDKVGGNSMYAYIGGLKCIYIYLNI